MKAVVEYLTKPDTLYKIVLGLVMLAIAWANLNSKIETVAQKVQIIENLDLNTKLSRMEVDIQWIKQNLESKIK